ncbi:hypothetical protein BDV12DRAFT_175062 [Aspergillus spectabilis]
MPSCSPQARVARDRNAILRSLLTGSTGRLMGGIRSSGHSTTGQPMGQRTRCG